MTTAPSKATPRCRRLNRITPDSRARVALADRMLRSQDLLQDAVQVDDPTIACTALSRSSRINGLAIACWTPRACAAAPSAATPARNWHDIAIMGLPGCAAR